MSVRAALGALAVAAAAIGASGCRSTRQRIEDGLAQEFQQNASLAMTLCGAPVGGISRVRVTNVQHAGSRSDGSGTATVTGTPTPLAGMPPPPPGACTGLVSYRYFTARIVQPGRRRGASAGFQVYDVAVLGRTAAGLAPVGPMLAPGLGSVAGAAGAAVPTQIGAIVAGTLQPGDRVLPDGRAADDYVVNLTTGQPVTIVVRGGPSMSTPGTTLDVFTELRLNDVELVHDDDGAGYPNSRILYTPTTTGPHVIRVTTFGAGLKQGAYTLQTYAGLQPAAR